MSKEQNLTMVISPQNSESKWVAIVGADKIISEGNNPAEVTKNAKTITEDFYLMFVPNKGTTYVF